MDCRDAEQLLFVAKDGAPTDDKRTALGAHIAGCPSCSRLRASIAGSSDELRESAQAAALPDISEEWREIRRRIQAPPPMAPAWFRFVPILGVPTAAAAALVIAFIAVPQWLGGPNGSARTQEAHAEFVEVPGSDATMVVFVDEPSGWLVVWAVTPSTDIGG